MELEKEVVRKLIITMEMPHESPPDELGEQFRDEFEGFLNFLKMFSGATIYPVVVPERYHRMAIAVTESTHMFMTINPDSYFEDSDAKSN